MTIISPNSAYLESSKLMIVRKRRGHRHCVGGPRFARFLSIPRMPGNEYIAEAVRGIRRNAIPGQRSPTELQRLYWPNVRKIRWVRCLARRDETPPDAHLFSGISMGWNAFPTRDHWAGRALRRFDASSMYNEYGDMLTISATDPYACQRQYVRLAVQTAARRCPSLGADQL